MTTNRRTTLTSTTADAVPQTYEDHHYQQYPQRQHDDRLPPVVGIPQGGWAGKAAGYEAAEAVRKA